MSAPCPYCTRTNGCDCARQRVPVSEQIRNAMGIALVIVVIWLALVAAPVIDGVLAWRR